MMNSKSNIDPQLCLMSFCESRKKRDTNENRHEPSDKQILTLPILFKIGFN